MNAHPDIHDHTCPATAARAGSPRRRAALAGLLLAIVACTPRGQGVIPTARTPAGDGADPADELARVPAPPATRIVLKGAPEEFVEVRLICLAPSPYTHRHDALRAGFGIYLLLDDLILQQRLPIQVSYYDASTFYDDRDRIAAVLAGARVIAVGGSTWSQGPSLHVRRFFELAGGEYLGGVSATAWATAGGAHTGGEEVVEGILRSLMGMGAQTFTLGQKYMVFTTDERVATKPGAFTSLDLWYMDQFARTIAVAALASDDPAAAEKLAKALGTSPYYFLNDYPPDDAVLQQYDPLLARLNAAADPDSKQFAKLRKLLADPPAAR